MSNALKKSLNLIIDNATRNLADGTSAPQNAVYTSDNTLLDTLNDIKKSIPTNYTMNNTQFANKTVFYFCFMIEGASRVKQMFGKDKQYSYTLRLYKNDDTTPMIYKIGFMKDNILGIKQEKHVFGDNILDATRLVKDILQPANTETHAALDTYMSNLMYALGISPPIIIDEKVNLHNMLLGIMKKKQNIRFIPIVPPKPGNVGGYRKTYKQHRRSKRTQKHRRRLH